MAFEKGISSPEPTGSVSVVDASATEKSELQDVKPGSTISDEKKPFPSVQETKASSENDAPYELNAEDVAEIPELVRNIVSFEDDPTLPVITFRSVFLSVVFCIVGSFVSQLS